jgi:peptidoglycan/xylan/chitin deacetylase (PgdA/CDA1 family)
VRMQPDGPGITFTLDLEPYGLRGIAKPPIDDALDALLDAAARCDAVGTVFVVGTLAEDRPDLVRRCAEAGHEIALHGYRHTPIDELGEAGFRDDLRRGRAVLEDLIGRRVSGYRAPLFSLSSLTPWAPGILGEDDFDYSSSVLPAFSPIRGLPGAPRRPFRWADGPIELPCPVGGIGSWAVPYLGGVYLRYVSLRLSARLVTRTAPDEVLWLYCHPYDADGTLHRLDLPQAGRGMTAILSARRGNTAERVRRVLRMGGGPAPPLGDRARALRDLPVVPAP